MSEHAAIPVQGATHLIIDEMARDGQVWGATDAADIQVVYQSAGNARELEVTRDGSIIRLGQTLVQRITLPPALGVTVKRAVGDLALHNLTSEVNIEVVHGDLRLNALAGTARIARVDGDLRADHVADLRLAGRCAGDLRFDAGGNLEAETVAGDVRIARAGTVRLNRVHGDLWVERLTGALSIEQVSGDARLTEIGGPVNLKLVRGDLRALDLAGGLVAPQVQGDATLQGAFAPAAAYTLQADGDISLNLPGEADVRLTVRANGRIRSDVQLTPTADGAPTFTATIGRGESRLQLNSMGDMRISQTGAGPVRAAADIPGVTGWEDLRTLGDRIRQQVTASLAAAGIMPEGGWSRHPRGARPARPMPPVPPTPPSPSRPPAPTKPSTEEELRILKMVEDGVISAAQAEMLFKALQE